MPSVISINRDDSVCMRRGLASILGEALGAQLSEAGVEVDERLAYMLEEAGTDQLHLDNLGAEQFRDVARATVRHADAVFRHELPASLNPMSFRDYAGDLWEFENAVFDDPRSVGLDCPPARDPSTPIEAERLGQLFVGFVEGFSPSDRIWWIQQAVRSEQPGLRLALEQLAKDDPSHDVRTTARSLVEGGKRKLFPAPVPIPWGHVFTLALVVLGIIGLTTTVRYSGEWWGFACLVGLSPMVQFLIWERNL